METTHSASLSIEGLIFEVVVGSDKETQPIEIDVTLFFPRLPLGCVSDELHDAINYNKCVEIIKGEVNQKHFRLIEHLAYKIHSALKKELPIYLDIIVRVSQLHPQAKKGVSFVYFPKKEQVEKKPTRNWDEE